jgi:hypothetical protein
VRLLAHTEPLTTAEPDVAVKNAAFVPPFVWLQGDVPAEPVRLLEPVVHVRTPVFVQVRFAARPARDDTRTASDATKPAARRRKEQRGMHARRNLGFIESLPRPIATRKYPV